MNVTSDNLTSDSYFGQATASPAAPVVVFPRKASPAKGVTPRQSPVAERVNTPEKPKALPRDLVQIWDVPFDRLDMSQSVDAIERLIQRGDPSYVVTANLNYCMLHHQHEQVRQITRDAALVLADGQPIVLRSRLKPNPLPARVAGSELIVHLCQRAAQEGWKVYFLGAAEGVADRCARRLQQTFPGLQVAGTHCPPFRNLSDPEQQEQLTRIRAAGTDLLFVAMGQPKGEKWIHENYQSLGVPVSIQLGASFDFIAGTATRAPEIYQRIGMEWAYRMISNPRRLMPRYAANAVYLGKALVQDWRRQVTQWGMGDWA